jgi:hypothetical protein
MERERSSAASAVGIEQPLNTTWDAALAASVHKGTSDHDSRGFRTTQRINSLVRRYFLTNNWSNIRLLFGTMSPMERLARLHGLLDEIHAETPSFTTVEDAAKYAGLVEQAARKIDALAIGVLDSVDRSGVHKDDGFSTAQSWKCTPPLKHPSPEKGGCSPERSDNS